MSYEDGLHHWSSAKNPYKIAGKTRRFPQKLKYLAPADVRLDGRGNVVYRPLLEGVPCFGNPVARLRFVGYRYVDPRTKHLNDSRCIRCKLADACQAVVDQRLNVVPTAKDLAERYLADRDKPIGGIATSSMTRLRSVLVDHGPFADSNRNALEALEQTKAGALRAKDAERKARERRRLLPSGEIHPDYLKAMKQERNARFGRLADYLIAPHAPSDLGRIPLESAMLITCVWMAREELRWTKKPDGPSPVARSLIAAKVAGDKTRNSLVQRIKNKDFARIDRFETEILPGESAVLWPKFDPEAIIAAW